MKKRDFEKLAASVRQAGAIKRGKMKTGRTTGWMRPISGSIPGRANS